MYGKQWCEYVSWYQGMNVNNMTCISQYIGQITDLGILDVLSLLRGRWSWPDGVSTVWKQFEQCTAVDTFQCMCYFIVRILYGQRLKNRLCLVMNENISLCRWGYWKGPLTRQVMKYLHWHWVNILLDFITDEFDIRSKVFLWNFPDFIAVILFGFSEKLKIINMQNFIHVSTYTCTL